MKWDPLMYDQKHGFVSDYGGDLLNWLMPVKDERILDVGCGTGELTNRIQHSGAVVTGLDISPEMIDFAKNKYPFIDFKTGSITDFHTTIPYDAVFSNAALHWVQQKDLAIEKLYNSLKSGGRLILEMGGKGNVENILQALQKTLRKLGFPERAAKSVFYFPTVAEYCFLLEKQGFTIGKVVFFERETLLMDENGIQNWLKMFGRSFLEGLPYDEILPILHDVEALLVPTNFKEGKWYADYKRLRILAHK